MVRFAGSVVCFFPWSLVAHNNRTGLDVTMNLEVSSKTTECDFDLVVQFMRMGSWQDARHTRSRRAVAQG